MNSTISALLGVALGSLLSFLATWLVRKNESRLRLTEKVLERQIQAHEKAAEIGGSLYQVKALGWCEDSGRSAELPAFLFSWDEYCEFRRALNGFSHSHSFWLDANANEEFGLLFAYFSELERLLVGANHENLWAVGLVLCPDFAEFSARIRNRCYEYLSQQVFALRPVRQHIGLSDSVRKRRRQLLANTVLFTRRRDVEKIINSDPQVVKTGATFRWFPEPEDAFPDTRSDLNGNGNQDHKEKAPA